ncbi:FAD-binding oxidoreductase [Sphingomonas ginkgonis]|uniref:FAD-binding oxidoreductase n=1 Tax=Sphingomonas ginkgonis TaxID=2315330 RepID=A0A3R9YM40_9SPHN|nr:FAD-binding oxidoreductase [Sphingomonas ginkgonis]RST30595.1 FAD-binding oxidoreductase [Sphingomonas ginkgonis]
MTAAQQQLIERLRGELGPGGVIDDPADIAPWLTDWRGRYHGASPVLLAPGSTAEVQAVVRGAAALGVPLVPQGGNSGMVGGATPPADGSALLVSLRRLNRVRAIDRSARLMVAEAGCILQNVHEAALEQGLRFPLTLGGKGSATIGGLVSTNAGGTQVLKFGTMRSLVLGIEAVLPDGTLHDGLTPLKKDNRGPSFDQLLCGAEGTLGIVTAATLRLYPAVAERAVAWIGVADPFRALELLRMMQVRTDRVEGFEIVPADTLGHVLEHIPGTRAPLAAAHRWNVLVEATVDGPGDSPAALLEALLGEGLERGLVEDAVLAGSEAQAEAFWKLRDSISEAERATGPAAQHDISVPVDDMPRFLVEGAAEVERAFPGVEASGFGHLGDGNIHFHVRAAARQGPDWYEREAPAVSRLVHDLVTAAGGSISAEHGIGQMKRDELARLSPGRVAALRALKAGLDPQGLFNPGKLVR